MRLTIGTTSYNNFYETWFTIQALRIYHDLKDCEIVVVDNYNDRKLKDFIDSLGDKNIRYDLYLDKVGTSCAKNRIFEVAKGEMVLCIDSHVFLLPGALDDIPVTNDLIQGPLVYNSLKAYICDWKPVWRGNMWGIWGDPVYKLPDKSFEIWGLGMGVFATKRNSWLKFNENFKGFGGEEGYIHEKYRKAGRKVLCNPKLRWLHLFDRKIPYPVHLDDRIRNYLIGFEELGLDTKPIFEHFGVNNVNRVKEKLESEKKSFNINVKKEKPLISALCITYGRPKCLEEAVESFLLQDYENKELIILNDLAEQELIFEHPQIKIFNEKKRYSTIGEKRNRSVELSSGNILVAWDDDDISLPWRLSQIAEYFINNPNRHYFKPNKAWALFNDRLILPHYNLFFMMMSFTKNVYNEVGRYPLTNYAEDSILGENIMKAGNYSNTDIPDDKCPFIYCWRFSKNTYHLSPFAKDNNVLNKIESIVKSEKIEPKVYIKPHWNYDYLQMTKDALVLKKELTNLEKYKKCV